MYIYIYVYIWKWCRACSSPPTLGGGGGPRISSPFRLRISSPICLLISSPFRLRILSPFCLRILSRSALWPVAAARDHVIVILLYYCMVKLTPQPQRNR